MAIFKNIDMRTQEHIMQRVSLVHKLLFTGKKDCSFMCMEILIAVMICVYPAEYNSLDKPVLLSTPDNIFKPYANNSAPAFSQFFKERFQEIGLTKKQIFPDDPVCYLLPEKANLYGAMIYFWYWIHKPNKQSTIKIQPNGIYEPIGDNYHELRKFAETFQLIK